MVPFREQDADVWGRVTRELCKKMLLSPEFNT